MGLKLFMSNIEGGTPLLVVIIAVSKTKIILVGRIVYQHNCISVSTRIRGRVPRAQMITLIITIVPAIDCEVRIMAENILIDKMNKYSAINSVAKSTLAYSVLYPDTNSLSPSAKSKGDRFSSAKILNVQKKATMGIINIKLYLFIIFNARVEWTADIDISRNAILTSYEIDWEILRIPPIMLHLELDDQPLIIMG